MNHHRRLLHPALALAVLGAGLAGCKSDTDVNLAVEPNDNFSSVKVGIKGIELRKDDGSTKKIDRNEDASPDLVQFDDTVLFAILTNAGVKKGTYNGVRILYTDDVSKVTPRDPNDSTPDTNVSEEDLDVPEDDADFTETDFKVKSNKDAQLLLAIDLRLSIVHDSSADTYTFTPVMRAVQSGDEAEIKGDVGSSFTDGDDCKVGAAVFAFPGADVDPKAGSIQPIATVPIIGGQYDLRYLTAGTYTIAVTCDGENQSGPSIDGNVGFAEETHNVTVKKGKTETQDF